MLYTIQMQKKIAVDSCRAAGMELSSKEEMDLNMSLALTGAREVPDDQTVEFTYNMEYAAVSYLRSLRMRALEETSSAVGRDYGIW